MATLAQHTLVVRLHSTDGTIQWVTTGNLLAMAVAIPVTGWAESRWGGKRAWMAALVLLVAGSVLCALSWSDVSLVGSRVLPGFAAGLIFPLLAGIALLGAFSAWTLRASNRQPIVDVRLLRLLSLGTASTVLFTAGAAMYAGMFLLPLYYQQLHGETVLHAGLLLIPQGVGSLAARFAVGKLTVRHRGAADSRAIPDTGTLRSDLLALLTEANTDRNPMAADYRSPLRPVPSRNDDDAQTRPRPRPAPDRRRHLHPARHHTTWYWAQPQTSWATLTMSSSLATSSS